jgi:hypothetical protein
MSELEETKRLISELNDIEFKELVDVESVRRNLKFFEVVISQGDGMSYSSVIFVNKFILKASSYEAATDNLIAKIQDHLKYSEIYKKYDSDKSKYLNRDFYLRRFLAKIKDYSHTSDGKIELENWHKENPDEDPRLDCPISWLRRYNGCYSLIESFEKVLLLLKGESFNYSDRLENDSIVEVGLREEESVSYECYGHHE